MKHLATYMLLVLGGNDSPSKDDIKKAMSAVGVEADDERLTKMLAELEGKDLNELMEAGKGMLAKFGGGGGEKGAEASALGGGAVEQFAFENVGEKLLGEVLRVRG